MRRMAVVITSAFPLNAFLRPHLERLRRDFEITVYVNTGDMGVAPDVPPEVRVVHLPLRRNISPFADLATLLRLWRILRRESFDLVFSMNPKSGLLAMVAAFITRVPRRVHCFTGQVWVTRRGFWRWLLKGMDRLLAACATHLLADSASQRQYLIGEGIVTSEKIVVLANGSIAGVDVSRFHPNENARGMVRSQFGIEKDACCLLYVGRLKRDKGIPDLVEAFRRLQSRFSNLQLLLVGPDEEGFYSLVRDVPQIHRVGYTQAVEDYMAAADVFCLPSYREGFGLVLIEAGAVGLPVVASRIYGITDAVVEGKTGLLYEPGDVDDLARKMGILIEDAALRKTLGEAGQRRASGMFGAEVVTAAMAEFVQSLFHDPSRRVG